MALEEIRRIFEKRRANLVHTLQNGKLDAAKQHQMYGAVKEIENFLKVLDEHREKEIQENSSVRLENEQKKPLFNLNIKRDEFEED